MPRRYIARTFIKLCVLSILVVVNLSLKAQNHTDAEIKTALVYNFIKHINHSKFEKELLRLGIYGDDSTLVNSLKKLETQKIKGKQVRLVNLEKNFSGDEVDVLFLFNEYNFELTRINKLSQDHPFLLITDRAEDKRQVMINFIHLENKTVNFEINSKNLEERGFEVLPKLLLLGGTELDVRKLYAESEKSLLSEQEKTKEIEKELGQKEKEVAVLAKQLTFLYTRIDSLNDVVFDQLNNIEQQKNNLDSLTKELLALSNEANERKLALDAINHTLSDRNSQINELDIELSLKKNDLDNASRSLNTLKEQIITKESILREQSHKIQSQNITLLVFLAFLIVLVILIMVINSNLKARKRRSIELEKRNAQINKQKEQIEFQAEELKMINLELSKLSIVAEKTDNAVIILNKSGDIEWVNDAFEKMQEIELSQFKERHGCNYINASKNKNASDLFKNCVQNKQPVFYDSHILTGNEHKKWLQTTLTPILDKNNEIEKFVIVDTDITKLKEAESKILRKNIEIEEKAKILSKQAEDLSLSNHELEKQKNRAEKALRKLKNAQSQLVAAEKMASLGQLTSGIAHEINNPINYISSSIEGLINILDDIKQLMNIYDSLNVVTTNEKVESIKKEIDYNDLLTGFGELTGNIKLGIDRTKEIVSSLRTFSRMDEDSYSDIEVNNSINSALILLGKQHKEHITIEKNYGNLPRLQCMAGKINQVFLNVLVNAVQSIDGEGTISISTSMEDVNAKKYVRIEFKDSGKGMPENVKERIFEPFFTTKDVGEGTGLGLSITYSIIKKHNGFIKVNSKVGQGTSFNIYLPVS